MTQLETRFRDAGRSCGAFYVRLKPVFEYSFYFLMIAYQCYDCVSDGINVYQYSTGDSLDVSGRDDRVYYAFVFSLIVSVVCALSSSVGYVLMVIGLTTKLWKHKERRNNTFKLGQLIVFISLFFQVSFEETIQCLVLYYFIVRCSVIFSFWKTSLFVCTTISLIISGCSFLKAAYLWCMKQDSLPRKYPSCLASCYNLEVSHIGCVALCLFGSLLSLGLFAMNIVTLVDIIRHSEVDVPHVLAENKCTELTPIKITQVKKFVKADKDVIEKIPCHSSGVQATHFLGDRPSLNCTTAIFTLSFAKSTKKLTYKLHYCFKNDESCKSVKATNITLKYSHKLCSALSPVLGYLGDPGQVVKTTIGPKPSPSNSSGT